MFFAATVWIRLVSLYIYFFLVSLFYIFSFFVYDFNYKHKYEIELTIGYEFFSFETLDKELFEDFIMLKFFYDTKYNIECN